ncbi:MFS transporter [Photorhabdus caribbeanensis]|uniref:MFS transporter n=1 Tax=Photorhabdus caribbeanensis TaxID=1004165 RepID=UPI001BD68477|nr:MFS transporter [Photorhabdus caribbeanensis]MBS9425033.1 MFS transporter [Photorhabdus caribbeanensis]
MLKKELSDRLHLFTIQPYLLFSLSGFLATVGNGLNYITLSWLVYHRSNSISDVALMMFFIWMPSIIFGPFFGVCADKFNRKTLLIISNAIRGAAVLIFTIFEGLGFEPNIFILFSILGIFISFYMPAAIPLIRGVVPEKDLINANATVDMIYEFGTIIGMGISGFLIIHLGMTGTLALGGLFFIISGILNHFMKCNNSACYGIDQSQKSSFINDYIESIRYISQKKELISTYTIQMFIMVILMTVPILLVPYTNEVLHAGTDIFAVLEALYSTGVLFGGFFSPILCRIISMKNTIFCLLVIMAFSLFFLSKNSNTFLAYPIYFLVGFGLSSWALSITLAQIMSDPAYQGRLQSTFNGLSGIGILAIYLLMNYQGKNIDVQNIYFWEFLLAIFAAIFVVFFRNKEAVHEK